MRNISSTADACDDVGVGSPRKNDDATVGNVLADDFISESTTVPSHTDKLFNNTSVTTFATRKAQKPPVDLADDTLSPSSTPNQSPIAKPIPAFALTLSTWTTIEEVSDSDSEDDEDDPTQQATKTDEIPSASKKVDPLDNVPGLCQKLGRYGWQCCFCTDTGPCRKFLASKRSVQRHIGIHAKWEIKALKEGKLSKEKVVAIHHLALKKFTCKIPDCRYLVENGSEFTVSDVRIDFLKEQHLKRYHANLESRKKDSQDLGSMLMNL